MHHSSLGIAGMLWAMAWIGAAVAQHFQLVGKLEGWGIKVPWRFQSNQSWVEQTRVAIGGSIPDHRCDA